MKRERAVVIAEALAIEQAGGTWEYEHVAAVTGYGVTYLRNCPDLEKSHERTTRGIKRDRVVFVPATVRAWKASLLKRAG